MKKHNNNNKNNNNNDQYSLKEQKKNIYIRIIYINKKNKETILTTYLYKILFLRGKKFNCWFKFLIKKNNRKREILIKYE